MANPVCSTTSLFTTKVEYVKALNPTQRKAALIYDMALALKAIGGTDYTTTMTTTLITDVRNLYGNPDNVTPDMMQIAELNIAANKASAAGASLPANFNALNAATGCCFQGIPSLTMDQIIQMLKCKLGTYKNYPQ